MQPQGVSIDLSAVTIPHKKKITEGNSPLAGMVIALCIANAYYFGLHARGEPHWSRRATKIWICCWIYFQIRTMLSGGPLVLCFVAEHPHGSSHLALFKAAPVEESRSNKKMAHRSHQITIAICTMFMSPILGPG